MGLTALESCRTLPSEWCAPSPRRRNTRKERNQEGFGRVSPALDHVREHSDEIHFTSSEDSGGVRDRREHINDSRFHRGHQTGHPGESGIETMTYRTSVVVEPTMTKFSRSRIQLRLGTSKRVFHACFLPRDEWDSKHIDWESVRSISSCVSSP